MSQPYYDLCVSTALLEPQTQRERVSQAIMLGWDAVALVHQAAAKLTEQDRCPIRPVELAALLAAAKGVREALAAAEARAGPRHGDPYTVRQLTRINIPVDDPAAAQAACASAVARGYDLVAVQPGSERLFQVACSSLECDLVSLDLSRRLPYRFKPAAVKAALARGLHFEICLAPALRDAASRRQLFANALALARETRGRGLVLSSGARSYMELRGPLDVINLATLLGLTPQQAAAAVTSAPLPGAPNAWGSLQPPAPVLIKSSAPAPVAPAPPAPVPASSPDALAPPEDFLLADLLAPRPGGAGGPLGLKLRKSPSLLNMINSALSSEAPAGGMGLAPMLC